MPTVAAHMKHEDTEANLPDGANAVQRLSKRAGNRATLQTLDAVQRHPSHHVEPASVGQNRYEVLGVEVPSPRAGRKLQPALQRQMEHSFNTDLSGIRINESDSANDLDSLAYTRGANIVMAPGHYQPHSGSGKQLVAHEIVHVIQQRADRVPAPKTEDFGLPVNQDHSLEREADRLGRRASWGMQAPVRGVRDTVKHRPRGVAQPQVGL